MRIRLVGAYRGLIPKAGVRFGACWVESVHMEHEVFVPVPAERLREVLDDPARVARAVPGLQQDAGAEPVTGRLKIRVGSHSVTYRGAVRVSRADDGAYAVEGDATEARGSGSVKLTLRIALRDAQDGTTVVFDGTAAADGRIKDLPSDAVEGAVTRLLNRFAEHLAAAAPETTTPLATQDFEPRATTDYETTPDADDAAPPPLPPAGAEGGVMADADEEAGLRRPRDAPARRRLVVTPTTFAPLRPATSPPRRVTPTSPRPRSRRRSRPGPRAPRRLRERYSAVLSRSLARERRGRRGRRGHRRGGARAADDDRAQCRGGRSRPAARPVRAGARAADRDGRP
ncbi:hypothetical protein SVIOM74S_08206 [Streptomyces violarus]